MELCLHLVPSAATHTGTQGIHKPRVSLVAILVSHQGQLRGIRLLNVSVNRVGGQSSLAGRWSPTSLHQVSGIKGPVPLIHHLSWYQVGGGAV